MFSFTMAVVVFLIAVVSILYRQNITYMQLIENSNRRAFTELTQSVRNIDVALSKAVLTKDNQILSKIANQITANANFAKSSLGQLPITDTNIDTTQKYLSQVGDYTIYLAEKAQNGQAITQTDTNTMIELLKYSDTLATTLDNLQDEYLNKVVFFSKMMKLSKEAQASAQADTNNQFTLLEQSFKDYPSLIYDGPFSDHLDNAEAEFLKGKQTITSEDGMERVKLFIGADKIKEINFLSQTENIIPNVYSYKGTLNDKTEFSVDVTIVGGQIMWYLSNKENNTTTLSSEEGIAKGFEFLKRVGFNNLAYSYYETSGGFITINYSPNVNGIKEYPDLVKIRISLDNGEVTGYEAKGYIMNHKARTPPVFATIDIKKYLNNNVEYTSLGKAVIPSDGGKELYVYEVIGKLYKRNYIIYLNATTGKTEKILLILENENGILTQ
jgi:germination protein YpeB